MSSTSPCPAGHGTQKRRCLVADLETLNGPPMGAASCQLLGPQMRARGHHGPQSTTCTRMWAERREPFSDRVQPWHRSVAVDLHLQNFGTSIENFDDICGIIGKVIRHISKGIPGILHALSSSLLLLTKDQVRNSENVTVIDVTVVFTNPGLG